MIKEPVTKIKWQPHSDTGRQNGKHSARQGSQLREMNIKC
jgi:hypothetical protein